MKKRVLGFLIAFLLVFVLIGCDGVGNGDGNGGDNDNDKPPQGKPTEIVIMHGAVTEVDPRHKDFTGSEAAARIALHEQIEEELNVKIVYKQYPADAPWGPGRRDAIIQWHAGGNAKADIYWITTIWLGEIMASNAIVPIDSWLSRYGRNLDDSVLDMTTFDKKTWGFAPEPFNGEKGLFYNTAIIEELNLDDPVDLWNRGEWTWDKFEDYALEAKAKIGSERSVLGGYPAIWAESLVPLNGGYIVNPLLEKVGFTAPAANAAYEYLSGLYDKGLFEENPGYDAGSELWGGGDVLFHPGNLWFVRADNRFGQYQFVMDGDIGVVPYPLPEGKTKNDYVIPLGGEAVYVVAANPENRAKEELAFEVWNRIQLWETLQSYEENFEDWLVKIFDEEKFVDVYMQIYNKVYYDAYTDLGFSQYGEHSWYSRVNLGVKDNTTRTKMEEITDVYEEALDRFLGKVAEEE